MPWYIVGDMQFVVAFDGSPITKTALERAVRFADGVGGTVTTVTVLPRGNTAYARQRGWIADDQEWDREAILDDLRASVESIAPDVAFDHRLVDRYAPRGKIGRVLRSMAEAAGVDVLVIGSENAGRVFTTLTTVTRSVASGTYDLHVVRSVTPLSR